MGSRPLPGLLAALILALSFTGCSGGGGGSSAPAAAEPGAAAPSGSSSGEFTFLNPASGAKLWGRVFRPTAAAAGGALPGLVLVPGGLGSGSPMRDMPQVWADRGFVVMVFDPDGRGLSEGTEDFNGAVHQEGLHALLERLAADPAVDPSNLGVQTSSYGLALAAGALGRHPDQPAVKYLVDAEGPSDRFYVTNFDDPRFLDLFGHTTADAAWWAEREASKTIRAYRGRYLRLQTSDDHVHGADMGHALGMIEAATGAAFGGHGSCAWTRMNGPENPPNSIWTAGFPPAWLSPGSLPSAATPAVLEMRDMTP